MANRPVIGMSICPKCNFRNTIIWNGNFKFTCFKCGKKYQVKRQKLLDPKDIRL